MLNHSHGGFYCYVITHNNLLAYIETAIIPLDLVHTYTGKKYNNKFMRLT